MKKVSFLIIFAALLLGGLAACGAQATEQAAEQELQEEIEQLDSLSNELEQATLEIEEKADSLDAALDALNFDDNE